MSIRAGELNRRAQIFAPIDSILDSGGPVTDWNLLGTVCCSIEPLNGREFFAAKQVDSTVTHKITMRFNKYSITPRYRLVARGNTYEISAAMNMQEMDEELIIFCTQRTGVPKEFELVNEDENDSPIFLEP